MMLSTPLPLSFVNQQVAILKTGLTSGFGKIGTNFGGTNLDNMPSSGGKAGYTSAIGVSSIPTPTPTKYYTTADGGSTISPPSIANGFNGFTLTPPSSSGVNTTQSGDVDPTLNRLLAEYANQFGGDTAARTSGTPVVVVPQGAGSDTGSAGPSAAPKLLVLLALGGVGYLGYRWYKNRGA